MILNSEDSKPIYVQIAEWLETEILSGNFQVDDKVYSQYQLAEMFTINPATAAKGLNLLAENEILYKRRGLGMFVADQARERILQKRKEQTLKKLVADLVQEAERLDVGEAELISMIQNARGK
ncbi:MAG: GntR family transcriptional regulator [Bacillus sp. (in: firmicutes)]